MWFFWSSGTVLAGTHAGRRNPPKPTWVLFDFVTCALPAESDRYGGFAIYVWDTVISSTVTLNAILHSVSDCIWSVQSIFHLNKTSLRLIFGTSSRIYPHPFLVCGDILVNTRHPLRGDAISSLRKELGLSILSDGSATYFHFQTGGLSTFNLMIDAPDIARLYMECRLEFPRKRSFPHIRQTDEFMRCPPPAPLVTK